MQGLSELRKHEDLTFIAAAGPPESRGWVTYYGRFYRTALNPLLERINSYLVRWAKRKYKRLRTLKRVRRWWMDLTARRPDLFAHWKWVTGYRYSL